MSLLVFYLSAWFVLVATTRVFRKTQQLMLQFKQQFETLHTFKGEIRFIHVMFKALVVILN